MLTQQQITARTSIRQDRAAIRNLKADLAAIGLLHLVITTTKAAQGIDQALLAQVRSLLPLLSRPAMHFHLKSTRPPHSNSNDYTSTSWRVRQHHISHYSLLIITSRYTAIFRHRSFSPQIALKPTIATTSRLRLNMNSTNRRSGTPNQDANP